MASEITSSTLRGLGLLGTTCLAANLDETLTTATQAGPEPGDFEADADGWLELEATGSSSAGAGYSVATAKAGAAVGGDAGGRFRQRKSGLTGDTDWQGWQSYNKVTGFDWVKHTGNVGGSDDEGWRHINGLTLPSGRVVTIYDNQADGEIGIGLKHPTTGVWSHSTLAAKGTSPTYGAGWSAACSLARLDLEAGPRVFAFVIWLAGDIVGSTERWTMRVWYSDDEGVTWAVAVQQAQGIRLNANGGLGPIPWIKLRTVTRAGYTTAAVNYTDASGGPTTYTWHLVSPDLGASWTEVDKHDVSSVAINEPELLDTDTGLLWLYRDASGILKWVRPAGPYDSVNEAANWDSAFGYTGAVNRHVATIGDDGDLYVVGRHNTAEYRLALFQCTQRDPGTLREFEALSTRGPANVGGDTGVTLLGHSGAGQAGYTLVRWGGSLRLVGNHESNNAYHDESLGELALGGYESIDWPFQTFGYDHQAAVTADLGQVYLPLEGPGTITNWTPATTGTVLETLTIQGLQLADSGAGPNRRRLESTTAIASANRVSIIRARVAVSATGSSGKIGVDLLRTYSGANQWRLTVYVGTTFIEVWDTVSAATSKGTATGLTSGAVRDIMAQVEYDVASGNVYAAVYWKLPTDTIWTEVVAQATLATAATGGTDTFAWGHLDGGAGRASAWLMVGYSSWSSGLPINLARDGSTWWPEGLQGRPFATRPIWLADGWLVRARGGVALAGDEWKAAVRYERGARNLDPTLVPSPSVGWQSTATTAQVLAWSPAGGADHRHTSTTVVGIVAGTRGTWRTALLKGWTGSAYDTLMTIDLAQDLTGLYFTRSGTHLTPATGTPHAAGRYVLADELAGCVIVLDPSGTPYARRILHNSEGIWASTAGRRVQLEIEGDLTGLPTSGACEIRHQAAAFVVHNLTTAYQAYALEVVTSQALPPDETGYRAGVFDLGPLALFGRRPSWGRVLGHEPQQDISEGRGGARSVERLGPVRRSVRFNFVDHWSIEKLLRSTPDHDYLVAASGYPGIGVAQDAHIMEGILGRQRGAVRPVVYLAHLPDASSSDTHTLTGRRQFLYGRIVSPVTMPATLGDEDSDETLTINEITIEEEL